MMNNFSKIEWSKDVMKCSIWRTLERRPQNTRYNADMREWVVHKSQQQTLVAVQNFHYTSIHISSLRSRILQVSLQTSDGYCFTNHWWECLMSMSYTIVISWTDEMLIESSFLPRTFKSYWNRLLCHVFAVNVAKQM